MDFLWNSPTLMTLISILMICLYLPLNRFLTTGFLYKHRFDDFIPFLPIWIYPYIFLYYPWMAWFYLNLFFQSLSFIQQAFIATFISNLIGQAFFFFHPTYIITHPLHGSGFTIKLHQWLHHLDREFNALPSMYVYMSTLLALLTSQLHPQLTPLAFFSSLIIIASTVLIKRHYLYDIIAGLAVGLVGYLTSLYFT